MMKQFIKVMTVTAIALVALVHEPVMAGRRETIKGPKESVKRDIKTSVCSDGGSFRVGQACYTRITGIDDKNIWTNSKGQLAGKTVVPNLEKMYKAFLDNKINEAAHSGLGHMQEVSDLPADAEILAQRQEAPANVEIPAQRQEAPSRTWYLIKVAGVGVLIVVAVYGIYYLYQIINAAHVLNTVATTTLPIANAISPAVEQAGHSVAEQASRFSVEQARSLAAEQARSLAAEQTKRFAEEQARHFAEEQARHFAEEQARHFAVEQARSLAAEQTKRFAEEQAGRLAAEQARHFAVEQARSLAAEQTKRFAEEQARHFAEEQARHFAEEQARHLARVVNSSNVRPQVVNFVNTTSPAVEQAGHSVAEQVFTPFLSTVAEQAVNGPQQASIPLPSTLARPVVNGIKTGFFYVVGLGWQTFEYFRP